MEGINHSRLSYVPHHDEFCQALAAQVAFIHCRQVLKENQIAIRVENGYGVTILPVPLEAEVFEVLVLRFYGAGLNDYQVAQYAPIPELNRGDFNEIVDLCKQVARLPISKARTGYSGQAKTEVRNKELARRCSNFL
jgi:CelD/BcsL family acetyltransferase involved in cellulose biosynthesis